MTAAWDTAAARALPEEQTEPTIVHTTSAAVKRKRGQKTTPLEMNWDELEYLYVDGEKGDDGVRRWPLSRVLAQRYGVSEAAIAKRVSPGRWREKRAAAQARYAAAGDAVELVGRYLPPVGVAHEVAREARELMGTLGKDGVGKTRSDPLSAPPLPPLEEILKTEARLRGEPTDPGSRPPDDPLAVVNHFLSLFSRAVMERRALPFTVSEYEKAVKLRLFLENEAAAQRQARQVLSLEQLQERHRELRQAELAVTDGIAGVLAHPNERPSHEPDLTADSDQKRQSSEASTPDEPEEPDPFEL